LFLTTNRIGDFDEAVVSRVHISLYYPVLDRDATRQVFELNLQLHQQRLKKEDRVLDIEDGEILVYAMDYFDKHVGARWNGRQIRNACQTALALAEYEAQEGRAESVQRVTLQLRHLEVISNAYLEFISYLKVLHGVDANRRAHESGIRAPELGTKKPKRMNPLVAMGSQSTSPLTEVGSHTHRNNLQTDHNIPVNPAYQSYPLGNVDVPPAGAQFHHQYRGPTSSPQENQMWNLSRSSMPGGWYYQQPVSAQNIPLQSQPASQTWQGLGTASSYAGILLDPVRRYPQGYTPSVGIVNQPSELLTGQRTAQGSEHAADDQVQ
jgi:hypothetical protein